MVSISNPFNVYLAAKELNKYKNIIYGMFLTNKLIQKVKFNESTLIEIAEKNEIEFDLDSIKKSWSIFEFDQKCTYNFINTEQDMTKEENIRDYYLKFSCSPHIDKVETPILIIHSKNDPISKYEFLPIDKIK